MSIRPVQRIVQSKPTMEGAGVKLHRAFGFGLVLILEVVVYCESFKRVAVATSHGTNINMGARHYGCFDPPR